MPLHFEFAGDQIDGDRDYQEDAFLVTHFSDKDEKPSALTLVADGMGGHAAGNLASNIAVQEFQRHVGSLYPATSPCDAMVASLHKANGAIAGSIKETPDLGGMGCTLVGAMIERAGLWWCSVGDSHIYLVRDNKLQKKNADHSYGGFLEEMKQQGKEVQPQPGMRKNMLMSAVTGDEIPKIDCPKEPMALKAGDRVILCSDGMDTLEEDRILELSRYSKTPKDCAAALLKGVKEKAKPRQDNTTVIVIDVSEVDESDVKAATRTEVRSQKKMSTAELQAALRQRAREEQQKAVRRGSAAKSGSLIGYVVFAIIILGGIFGGIHYMGIDLGALTSKKQEVSVEEAIEIPPAPTAKRDELSTIDLERISQVRKLTDTMSNGASAPKMLVLPGGTFMMGDSFAANPGEIPAREVTVRPFAISEYEITVADYNHYVLSIPGNEAMPGTDRPVTGLTRNEANAYATWLSQQTGHNYRLPSEAEWEYAAGGTATTAYWWGPRLKPGRAHCINCSSTFPPISPAPIGRFQPNPFGLYDTSGNVAELVADCWHTNYYDAPTEAIIRPGGDCERAVIRGGSFESPEASLRTSFRDNVPASYRSNTIGFRLVREVPQQQAQIQQTEQQTQQN